MVMPLSTSPQESVLFVELTGTWGLVCWLSYGTDVLFQDTA